MKHTTFTKIYLHTGRPDETYDSVFALLDGSLLPQNNITHERFVFQNVRQNVDENIHQFYMRVKEQAVKSDFGATLEQKSSCRQF